MRVTKCGVCECKGEYEVECEGMRVNVSVGCVSVRVSMRATVSEGVCASMR